MLKVGLTGGLACGKSFIANELARLGCHVIHADVLGHEVLAPDNEAYRLVLARFGNEVVDADGSISRPRLAARVFRNPEELAALNSIIHPAVRRLEEEQMAAIEARDPNAIVVLEAAILIEAGAHQRFDCLVVADCTEERQLERALARDATASATDISARLERQMPRSEKLKFADFVIDTSGVKEETLRQTREVYEQLGRVRK